MTELLVMGGERVEAADGATIDVIEPATAAPMAEVAKAGPEDATRAVDRRHGRVRGRRVAAHCPPGSAAGCSRRRRS